MTAILYYRDGREIAAAVYDETIAPPTDWPLEGTWGAWYVGEGDNITEALADARRSCDWLAEVLR